MGKRSRLLLVTLLCAGVLACSDQTGADSVTRADAAGQDAYFLWAGVRPPPELAHARMVYILAGEVRAGNGAYIVPLRPQVPQIDHADIWLVIRVETLDWQESTQDQLARMIGQWSAQNRLAGVQIDFDSATLGLEHYASFLADLRKRLPAQYQLSITGLMDWSANGERQALDTLAGTVDEIVIQTYQGRSTIPGFEAYLDSFVDLPMPYKIGIVQDADWQVPASVRRDPEYRGNVVFLLNPPGRASAP
ncbi:MAG: DUF3142 domain-containing protein [Sphingomonadaceae bacterium]